MEAHRRGDYRTAYRLAKPLAEQGLPEAQFVLGYLYVNGQGVPQDYAEAAKWYRNAADQGDESAQFGLGLLYFNGQGVPQSYAEAAKWFRRAAEQGVASAQSNLGLMYFSGQGVPQDYVLAHKWLNLAASRYPESENEKRKKAERSRDMVASRMSPVQVAEAQRLAREWQATKEP